MQNDLLKFCNELVKIDKILIENDNNNKVTDEEVKKYEEYYKSCKTTPSINSILTKLSVINNSQQHGKEFERNLKLLISVFLSDGNLLPLEQSKVMLENILKSVNHPLQIKKIGEDGKKVEKNYGEDDEDYPISNIYFLPHTEHVNDEKDIDTNQILNKNSAFIKYHNKFSDNNIHPATTQYGGMGVRSHYEWEWENTKETREKASRWIGSGINIKCCQMDKKNNVYKLKNEEKGYLPKGIDCAKSTTFYKETGKDEDWIFSIGIWEQEKGIKCIKGVWFIKMDKTDHEKIWGYCKEDDDPNDKNILKNELYNEIENLQTRIELLQKFNARPHLKLLHYYGSIAKAKKRLEGKKFFEKIWNEVKEKWEKIKDAMAIPCWGTNSMKECEDEKAKMVYGGCYPIHTKLKKMLSGKETGKKSLISLTMKVQGNQPQNRLQCHMNKGNFKKFLTYKDAQNKLFWCSSEKYPFICKPIISNARILNQKGGEEVNWDDDNIEFYFDDDGIPHPFAEEDDYLTNFTNEDDVNVDYDNESIQDIKPTDSIVNSIKKTKNDLEKLNQELMTLNLEATKEDQNKKIKVDGEEMTRHNAVKYKYVRRRVESDLDGVAWAMRNPEGRVSKSPDGTISQYSRGSPVSFANVTNNEQSNNKKITPPASPEKNKMNITPEKKAISSRMDITPEKKPGQEIVGKVLDYYKTPPKNQIISDKKRGEQPIHTNPLSGKRHSKTSRRYDNDSTSDSDQSLSDSELKYHWRSGLETLHPEIVTLIREYINDTKGSFFVPVEEEEVNEILNSIKEDFKPEFFLSDINHQYQETGWVGERGAEKEKILFKYVDYVLLFIQASKKIEKEHGEEEEVEYRRALEGKIKSLKTLKIVIMDWVRNYKDTSKGIPEGRDDILQRKTVKLRKPAKIKRNQEGVNLTDWLKAVTIEDIKKTADDATGKKKGGKKSKRNRKKNNNKKTRKKSMI